MAYQKWLKANESSKELVVKPTILHSRKIDVETENERELRALPGQIVTFRATDTFTPLQNKYAQEAHYLKPLEDTIPAIVSLKVGAQVMLKANLNLELGLANGSRGVVLELFPGDTPLVKVKWVNGTTSLVEPFTWIQRDKDGFASRSQMPFILAWSLTIHKCLGCLLIVVLEIYQIFGAIIKVMFQLVG